MTDRFLFMSDSTSYLSIRDAETFALIFRGAITLDGQIIPPQLLNELECVGDNIYANAWNTNYIFVVDKFTGVITALIDAAGLLTDAELAALSPGSVLNGIAWNPESRDLLHHGQAVAQAVRSRLRASLSPAATTDGQDSLTLLL